MKKILSLIIISISINACSSKFSLQKRKYTKGFYFSSSGHKSTESSNPSSRAARNAAVPNLNKDEPSVENSFSGITNDVSILNKTIDKQKNLNHYGLKKTQFLSNHQKKLGNKNNFEANKSPIKIETKNLKNKRDGFFKTILGFYLFTGGMVVIVYGYIIMAVGSAAISSGLSGGAVVGLGLIVMLIGIVLAYVGVKLII